jgi:hypothetical protein
MDVIGRAPSVEPAAVEDETMIVMIVYVVLVAAGEAVAVGIGSMLDKYIAAGWSMIVAMGLFFGVIALMWPVAVFITERWFVREPAK